MPVGRFIGPQCSNGEKCHPGWPARPVNTHGFCVACWMSLSAGERALAAWTAENAAQPTASLDTLEVLYALPDYEGPEGRAA